MMRIRPTIFIAISVITVIAISVISPQGAYAHQPYCEFADVTSNAPWQVPDSTISYAYFGNLYPAGDIDYFTFEAEEGQSVLVSMSIPAIDGQEDFAPVMVLSGPGVEGDVLQDLPANRRLPVGGTDDRNRLRLESLVQIVFSHPAASGRLSPPWQSL